ncbi:MAG TPA: DNA repair exonuclease [Balneolaceae bacterium]|nr:DNA repair exonuclease [Balneolaceae bacterium]
MKILASADLHLGKKSSAVDRDIEESATKFTWQRLVKWAIDQEVDAVALAGDIIDRDNRFFETIGPIQQGFEALDKAGIPVVMVAGNHDYDVLPEIMQNSNYEQVHLLGQKGRWESLSLQHHKEKMQFLGWSFPRQHVRDDPLIQTPSADLDPNIPTIGLVHGDFNNPESSYAPLAESNLMSAPVDCWIMGHIHKPEILRSGIPTIMYPGSPQALSPKEQGSHGPFLLTLDGREQIDIKQIPLSPVRYETLEIDISQVEDESEFRSLVLKTLADEEQNRAEAFEWAMEAVYDLILTGRHAPLSELDGWAQMASEFKQTFSAGTTVTIRTIKNAAEPAIKNIEQLASQPTPPGLLAQTMLDIRNDDLSSFSRQLLENWKKKAETLNSAGTYHPLRQADEWQPVNDEAGKTALLQECRRLLGELLSQETES